MKRRPEESNNNQSSSPSTQNTTLRPEKFELSLDFDDILAVAVFDSVLRVKRRRSKSRGAARRAK
jgi:hypothetical protein